MPASSSDLIDVALFSAFSRKASNEGETLPYSCPEDGLVPSLKQASLLDFELNGSYKKSQLNSGSTSFEVLQAKYGVLKGQEGYLPSHSGTASKPMKSMTHLRTEDKLEEPPTILWSHEKVALGWRKGFPPGAGIINLGNTCYMNSSLQALFHIPSMANWLLEEATTHIPSCEANIHNASFCSICAMMRTLKQTLDRSNSVIKPSHIHDKLKCIGKTLIFGRQEDAHEFIKLLLDHMEKSFLTFMRATKLDHRSKETTPLNQIFGGYLRQQVICPLCSNVSTTFSHFQDIVLDIRSVGSVDEALNLYFKKETLDSDNAYKCEKCHKKVPATKRHLIEKAPHVLLLQLKRFAVNGGKITKHVNIQKTIDLSRYVTGVKSSSPNGPGPYCYKLVSMVIHIGGSLHGGHYTAIAEASNNTMFEFDDSMVRPIPLQSALLRNPYILFYELVHKPAHMPSLKQVIRQSSETSLVHQNLNEKSLKTLPASLSTNNMIHRNISFDNRGSRNKPSSSSLPNRREREKISFGFRSFDDRSSSDNTKNGFTPKSYLPSSIVHGSGIKSDGNHRISDSSLNSNHSRLVPYHSDDSEEDCQKLLNGHLVEENGHNPLYENGSCGSTLMNGMKMAWKSSQTGNKVKQFYPPSPSKPCNKPNSVPSNYNGQCSEKVGMAHGCENSVNSNHVSNGDIAGAISRLSTGSEESSPSSSCSSSSSRGSTLSEKRKKFLRKKVALDSSLSSKGKLDANLGSLKSKTLDSSRTDKQKSVKQSIFSLFTCGTSFYSQDGRSPDYSGDLKGDKDSRHEVGPPASIEDDTAFSKRDWDGDNDPASPSKKCKPGSSCESSKAENDWKSTATKKGSGLPSSSSHYSVVEVPNLSIPPSDDDDDPRKDKAKQQNGSQLDETSDSDDDDDDSERTAKRNSECKGNSHSERKILNSGVVEVQWNRNVSDLSSKLIGSRNSDNREKLALGDYAYSAWNHCRTASSCITKELNEAGDYALGVKVDTWNGTPSTLDQEVLKARHDARKRTVDDIYNEELDAGQVAKKKYMKFEDSELPKENPFQKYQEANYNHNENSKKLTKSWGGTWRRGSYDRNSHRQYEINGYHSKNNFKCNFNKWNNNSRGYYRRGNYHKGYHSNVYHGNTFWSNKSGGRKGPYVNNRNHSFHYKRHESQY